MKIGSIAVNVSISLWHSFSLVLDERDTSHYPFLCSLPCPEATVRGHRHFFASLTFPSEANCLEGCSIFQFLSIAIFMNSLLSGNKLSFLWNVRNPLLAARQIVIERRYNDMLWVQIDSKIMRETELMEKVKALDNTRLRF